MHGGERPLKPRVLIRLRAILLAAGLASSAAAEGPPPRGAAAALEPAAERPAAEQSAPKAGAAEAPGEVAGAEKKPSKFRSPEDGWLDVSAFLDEKWGFVPLLVPITEPAVGYGGALGLMFIGKPSEEEQAGFNRPSLTAAMGLLTENGTWGGGAVDLRQWMDDRLQTLVAVIHVSANLDFHGIGSGELQDHPLSYNLQPTGGLVRAKYRLWRSSRVWAGLGYQLAQVDAAFDAPSETPGLPVHDRTTTLGGLTPSLTYDSRDSLFTPGRGTYVEASASFYGSALGGEDTFERAALVAMQYVPLHARFTLGVRGDLDLSFGDVPFYLRPYVTLRGAPVLRYQGEHAASVETELRFQFWKRFSLVGFAGTGAAWTELDSFEKTQAVTTGGGGFRYELARKYKLHVGIDAAFGPDGPAFYVQVGSAWFRP